MRKLVVFAALFVFVTSLVGCRAEGEIDNATSVSVPR